MKKIMILMFASSSLIATLWMVVLAPGAYSIA